MGILTIAKGTLKLAKLKDRVKKNSCPATIAELAQFHIQWNDERAAYKLLQKNMDQYPDSETLRSLWNYVRKFESSDQVRDALQAVEDDPNIETYGALIEIFLSQGDLNSAAEYCRGFMVAYPESGLPHRLMGEIRLDRFSHDFASKDGKAARKSLAQALDMDEEDQEARLHLACLYYCCGLTTRSSALVNELLEADSEHEEALELKEALARLPEEDDDPDFRFSMVEERRGFFHIWPEGDEDEEDGDHHVEMSEEASNALEECLGKSLEIEGGACTALFMNREGEKWGAAQSEEEDEEGDWKPFSRFVERIQKVSQTASLRMDIGSFEKAIIEGSEGGVYLRELRDGTLAFHLEDGRTLRKGCPALRDLVEEIAALGGKYDDEKTA